MQVAESAQTRPGSLAPKDCCRLHCCHANFGPEGGGCFQARGGILLGSGTLMGTGEGNWTLLSSRNGHVDRGKETKDDVIRER